jgi:hypothetical protein
MTPSADDSFTGGAGAQEPRPRDYFLDFNHQQLCDERETLRSQADSLRRVMQRWFTDISPVMGLLRFPADFHAELHGSICWGLLRATGREESRLAQHEQEKKEANQAGRPPPRAPCTTVPLPAERGACLPCSMRSPPGSSATQRRHPPARGSMIWRPLTRSRKLRGR